MRYKKKPADKIKNLIIIALSYQVLNISLLHGQIALSKHEQKRNMFECREKLSYNSIYDSSKVVYDSSGLLLLSGYIEVYYSYDYANPSDHNRPPFVCSYNRHNEVNLNLGFIKAAYEAKNYRVNIALMAGTYVNANLASEPGILKNIFEANGGVKISNKKELWIDGGIFPSHIGFEGPTGKDCWNLTRSILADNSPYYESGVRVSYTSDNKKWTVRGLALNGWQRIQRVRGNQTPAFGHQLVFSPNSTIILNSSSFVGSDDPDSVRRIRYFHNFYGILNISKNLGIILGFDLGAQQKTKSVKAYDIWYSYALISKYTLTKKVNIAIRGEYYSDPRGVIVDANLTNGLEVYGYSLNIDYHITDTAVWRIESRGFTSKSKIFILRNNPSYQNYVLTTALAISF